MTKKVISLFFGVLLILSLTFISAAPFWKKNFNSAIITGNTIKGSWSAWYDLDNPSGKGDYESRSDLNKNGANICDSPLDIECRTLDGLNYSETNETVRCEPKYGFNCINRLQSDDYCNHDYKVRFYCKIEEGTTNQNNQTTNNTNSTNTTNQTTNNTNSTINNSTNQTNLIINNTNSTNTTNQTTNNTNSTNQTNPIINNTKSTNQNNQTINNTNSNNSTNQNNQTINNTNIANSPTQNPGSSNSRFFRWIRRIFSSS